MWPKTHLASPNMRSLNQNLLILSTLVLPAYGYIKPKSGLSGNVQHTVLTPIQYKCNELMVRNSKCILKHFPTVYSGRTSMGSSILLFDASLYKWTT